MKLNKIISGGQKGADLGGLLGARNAGMATGGTAAAGWMTQDGPDSSLQQYGLVQGQAGKSTAQTYFFRTERNVLDADATVIFGDITSPGSAQTVNLCQRHRKPYLHFSPEQLQQHPRQCVTQLADWLAQQDIAVLNVAGNRERKAPGLQKRVSLIVERAIEQLKEQALGNHAPSPTEPQRSPVEGVPVTEAPSTEPASTPQSTTILRVAWWVSPESSPIPVERCESVLHQARGLAEQWHYQALHLVGDCGHTAEVPVAQAALNLRHQQQQGELPANPVIQIVAPLSTGNEQWRSLADHHSAATDLPELVNQLQGSDLLLLVGDAPQIHSQLQMAHAQGQSVLQLSSDTPDPLYLPAPKQREQTLEAAEPVAVVESAKAKEQMEL